MPLTSYQDALDLALAHVKPTGEDVAALGEAHGRVLTRSICADRDQPPFNRSAMDGFAVRTKDYDSMRTYRVAGSVPAGAPPSDFSAGSNDVIRIATGAAVPDAFDAVIPVEQAEVVRVGDGESVHFTLNELAPGRNIHPRAADAHRGQVLLEAGNALTPQAVGLAAAVGAVRLHVARRPRVALLTTGDEVRPPETPVEDLAAHQIRSSNGPMLEALVRAAGAALCHQAHVNDERSDTLEAARCAMVNCDLVVTVGGVSAGQRDLLPSVWAELGLTKLIHGVAIQPGKPIFIARSADSDDSDDSSDSEGSRCMVFGLPGNPVSVLATAHLFLWPAIRKMLGQPSLPWRSASLAHATPSTDKRELFRVATLNADGSATVLPWHGSGDLAHTARATGWVRLPQEQGDIEAGRRVAYLPMLTLT